MKEYMKIDEKTLSAAEFVANQAINYNYIEKYNSNHIIRYFLHPYFLYIDSTIHFSKDKIKFRNGQITPMAKYSPDNRFEFRLKRQIINRKENKEIFYFVSSDWMWTLKYIRTQGKKLIKLGKNKKKQTTKDAVALLNHLWRIYFKNNRLRILLESGEEIAKIMEGVKFFSISYLKEFSSPIPRQIQLYRIGIGIDGKRGVISHVRNEDQILVQNQNTILNRSFALSGEITLAELENHSVKYLLKEKYPFSGHFQIKQEHEETLFQHFDEFGLKDFVVSFFDEYSCFFSREFFEKHYQSSLLDSILFCHEKSYGFDIFIIQKPDIVKTIIPYFVSRLAIYPELSVDSFEIESLDKF